MKNTKSLPENNEDQPDVESESVAVSLPKHEAAERLVSSLKDMSLNEAVEIIEDTPGLLEILAERLPVPQAYRKSSHLEISNGPIPPPTMLADYEHVAPGSADKIIGMATKEQDHVHDMNSRIQRRADLDLYFAYAMRFFGLGSGFTVSLIGIYCAYQLGMNGHEIAAGALSFGGLAGLVGVFIRGNEKQNQEKKKTE